MNTRNRQFFDSLSGLKRGLDHVIDSGRRPPDPGRTAEDVAERKAKQAAKLARRAKAAGFKP